MKDHKYYDHYLALGLHVTEKKRDVLRKAHRVLHERVKNKPEFKDLRKEYYEAILYHHRQAQELFNYVATGG